MLCVLTVTDTDYCVGETCPEALVCVSDEESYQCQCLDGHAYYQPLGTNNCTSM